MPELHDLLERRASGYGPPADLFERVHDRRRRRDRSRRIRAGVLGVAVVALAALGFVRLLGSERTPADDPVPSPAPPSSGTIWPQTSPEEVRQAQELADAGDPNYTWQVDRLMAEQNQSPARAAIFTRFLREKLGWEAFEFGVLGRGEGVWNTGEGTYSGVVFVRCASGQPNPLYPNDPGACAPTIDGVRYETVTIDAAQLDRRDRTGIWVVTGWQTLPPFEQLEPPSDAEVTELVNGFLEARVAGEGAGAHLMTPEDGVPLLYETTGGDPYTRAEFERVTGPEWPYGFMELRVRLFAEDAGTVVEQRFLIDPCVRPTSQGCSIANPLKLAFYDRPYDDGTSSTTENGQAVADRYTLLDGEVTFAATDPPWRLAGWAETGPTTSRLENAEDFSVRFVIVADPAPVGSRCAADPPPADADAQAVAEWIRSDAGIEATEPVPVRIGGIDALQMDVARAPGAGRCDGDAPVLFTSDQRHPSTDVWLDDDERMRLYLLDLPGGSARILAIAVTASEVALEHVVEAAEPVVASFEFQAP